MGVFVALWSAPEDFESNRASTISTAHGRATAILPTGGSTRGGRVNRDRPPYRIRGSISHGLKGQITCNPIGGLTMRSY